MKEAMNQSGAARCAGWCAGWRAARRAGWLVVAGMALAAAACQPTVKIEAPDKPIEINLNVKIEQEVRVKVDRELDTVLAKNPDLF